ncbi:MAG: hypothetical protein ACD_60C00120G0018 [uncultured bacterium]|nr:MAG: hypothetical protein ACD_60C00120G0018 [uncultured bacterium]
MPKIAVLSLDYDGCADILFDDLIASYQSEKGSSISASFIKNLLLLRKKFMSYLNLITQDSAYVELYVGSTRQSIALDDAIAQAQGNGSCFKNYTQLCLEKNWSFQKLLLADVKNTVSVGTAMQNKSLTCTKDQEKIITIQHQLKDAASRISNPDDEINFYFFDDDPKGIIIPALIKCGGKLLDGIFCKINFFIVKYDWFIEATEKFNLQKPYPALQELYSLKKAVKETKETKQDTVSQNIETVIAVLNEYIKNREQISATPGLFRNFANNIENNAARSLVRFLTNRLKSKDFEARFCDQELAALMKSDSELGKIFSQCNASIQKEVQLSVGALPMSPENVSELTSNARFCVR